MSTRALLALLVPAVLATTPAFAADKAACLDAAGNAQQLRDTHKLVEARRELRVCAASECPTAVQVDCVTWLAEVEKALPSVVLTAKNGAGADLADVKVSVDGQPLVARLDGQSVPMNAGMHTFHFEVPGGAALDRQVLVKEGEKSQSVSVTFAPSPDAARVEAAPLVAPHAQATPTTPEKPAPGAWRTVGWIVGAVGVAGLGLGAVSGLVAISEKSSAQCDASGACDAGPLAGARGAATVSTIGLVTGAVLVAGGAALVLFAPSRDSASSLRSLRMAPAVGARDAGVVIGGAW